MDENSALRKVLVRVIPLNWVYVNASSLSVLFREFRGDQEKYQGSELLDVMFDAFWVGFKLKIFIFCFIPYLIYFSFTFLFLTKMLFLPGEEATEFEFFAEDLDYIDTYERPLRGLLLALLIYQLVIEVK